MLVNFKYYKQAVDLMLLVALGSIAVNQSKETTQTEDAVHNFLDYCATHPNEKLLYHASDMILRIHSDASYLSKLKDLSISAGHFFMEYQNSKNNRETNSTVHIV